MNALPLIVFVAVALCLLLAFFHDVHERYRELTTYTTHDVALDAIQRHVYAETCVTSTHPATSYECEFCGKRNRIGMDCMGCGHPQTATARTQ